MPYTPCVPGSIAELVDMLGFIMVTAARFEESCSPDAISIPFCAAQRWHRTRSAKDWRRKTCVFKGAGEKDEGLS